MKNKVFSLLVSILIFLIVFICYKFNNINVFTVDTIKLPQTEKYNIKVHKIDKLKVWEMENVYLYDGDQLISKKKDGKRIENKFFMVNKPVQNINVFFKEFLEKIDLGEDKNDECMIAYYFFRESKKLPKYWKPIWDKRCIDELSQHYDDLLFIITIDNSCNILSMEIP